MAVTTYYTMNGQMVGEKTAGSDRTDYMVDALGSVVGTTNKSNSVNKGYTYKPYGTLLESAGSGSDPRFMWVGTPGYRTTNRNHSTHYVRARHYAQEEGNWTTVDPMWPSEPTYAYGNSNPVCFTDQAGMNCKRNRDDPAKRMICLGPKTVGCCFSILIPISAYAYFVMALPTTRSSALQTGTLLIVVQGIRMYFSISGADCPPPHPDTTVNAFGVTSGFPRYQLSGRYWGKYYNSTKKQWMHEPAPLPPSYDIQGSWTLRTECSVPDDPAMAYKEERYRFHISPDPVKRLSAVSSDDEKSNNVYKERSLFRIHPDGGQLGTAGCIAGHPRNGDTAENIRHCLMNLNEAGITKMPLTVDYL